MQTKTQFQFNNWVILAPIIAIFSIWLVYWFEIKFGVNYNKYGVFPRTFKGLRGVLFSPFIHGDTKHLFNNSVPLAVLLASLFLFYRKVAFKILLFGSLASGLITWLITRESYHIGASGIVYLLVSFIFFSGIIRKHYRLIALSLAVVFLYGSLMWYLFPVEEGISWEGHLAGFISGLILAVLFRRKGPQKELHQFKQTEFDTWFDGDGNFSPPQIEEFDVEYEYVYVEEE